MDFSLTENAEKLISKLISFFLKNIYIYMKINIFTPKKNSLLHYSMIDNGIIVI